MLITILVCSMAVSRAECDEASATSATVLQVAGKVECGLAIPASLAFGGDEYDYYLKIVCKDDE